MAVACDTSLSQVHWQKPISHRYRKAYRESSGMSVTRFTHGQFFRLFQNDSDGAAAQAVGRSGDPRSAARMLASATGMY